MSHVIKFSSLSKYSRWLLLALIVGALSLAMACGSSDSDSDSDGAGDAAAPAADEADDALAEVSRVLSPDKTLAFEDYVAAGWKKSKQFGTDTVPEATDIWYGFFNAKDIEVRFYDSHEVAKTAGFDNAAEAIDQSFREGGQFGSSNRGAGSSAVTKYKGFAVVGNTVILCEQSVDSCIALAEVLGG
jgi:hypothetical protein|tara:strand:+ start:140 stop:700 length:561 start_codon:yes stop_codon:yes gene_type:complete